MAWALRQPPASPLLRALVKFKCLRAIRPQCLSACEAQFGATPLGRSQQAELSRQSAGCLLRDLARIITRNLMRIYLDNNGIIRC